MTGRALEMIRVLANTPPAEWRTKKEIHAALAEFRAPLPSQADPRSRPLSDVLTEIKTGMINVD